MSKGPGERDEAEAVRQRYAARAVSDRRYDFLAPDVCLAVLERQRETAWLLARHAVSPPASLRLVDVGCGEGGMLLEWLRIGLMPTRLQGIELIESRAAAARERLPTALAIHSGDAIAAPIPEASQDIVAQAVVFSSLLDDAYQQRLADAMWRWLKPGGAVLWYDFIVDNPANRDVRGMPLERVRELFPDGRIDALRVTLAPPIARRVASMPWLHAALRSLPFLRSHLLAWIAKPAD